MAVFKGSLIIFLFWLRPRKRVRRGYNAPKPPDDLSQCTLARPGQRLCHSKVADYRKRHPLISNRSHSHRAGKKKKVGVEWKWAVCHKELLHYKRACPWKKETKSYGRFSFQAPVRCQNCWRAGMNEEHNDWKLSHLFSLAVCKLSVNRRLSADADINDVFFFFFPLLSGVVALYGAFSLPPFIISITEKVREVWGEGRSVTTRLAVCWLMSVFAWSEACTSHIHSRKCAQELFAGLNVNLRQLVMFWTCSHTSGAATRARCCGHSFAWQRPG